MTIPIDNGSRVNGTSPSSVRGKSTQSDRTDGVESRTAGRAGGADASFTSERLRQVRDRIDASPEINTERVEQIKRALAEGRLPMDPQRIAQKFASLEGLLGD